MEDKEMRKLNKKKFKCIKKYKKIIEKKLKPYNDDEKEKLRKELGTSITRLEETDSMYELKIAYSCILKYLDTAIKHMTDHLGIPLR